VGQMAQFCRAMIEQQAMHSDLKLSNFLLRNLQNSMNGMIF
jgi:hypothetical protein